MWSGNSAFQLLIITSGGRFSGLFVYSGSAPAHGNLVASISATSGTDPFGNNYDAGIASYSGLSTAVLNASALQLFVGVTERATLSTSHFTVFNSSGATIYDVDLARAAQFLYHNTGSATQGILIASQSQNSGTDQFGNAYTAGLAVYSGPPALAIASLFSGALQVGTTAQFAVGSGIPPGRVGLDPSNDQGVLQLSSGFASVPDPVASLVTLSSQIASSVTGGLVTATAGALRVIAADGNTYGTERLLQQVSPRSQTINSTTGLTVGGLSASVGIGTYFVTAHLVIEWNAAAGQPELRFQGPAVSQFDLTHQERQSGSTSTANTNPEALAGTGGATGYNTGGVGGFYNPTGVMSGAGVFFIEDIEFWATFTAAGTLTLQAATTVAADTWIVFSGYWEVRPA